MASIRSEENASVVVKQPSFDMGRGGENEWRDLKCDPIKLALLGPVLQQSRWPTKIDLLHNQLACYL
jgi:hypothetical protein